MKFHFLNVKNADCNTLESSSRNTTVVDITKRKEYEKILLTAKIAVLGNFNQKSHFRNSVYYLNNLGKDIIESMRDDK